MLPKLAETQNSLITEKCKFNKPKLSLTAFQSTSSMRLPSHMPSSISSFASEIKTRHVNNFLLKQGLLALGTPEILQKLELSAPRKLLK